MNVDVGIGTDAHSEFKVIRRAELGVDIETPNTMLHDYFVRASAEALPFRDNAFEVAYAYNVLEHISNPQLGIRELMRVASVEVRIRQDRLYHIGNYATPSHLQFQMSNLRFKAYPRTRIGVLFSKWLRRLMLQLMLFNIEWAKGRRFSFSPIIALLTSETHFQYLVVFKKEQRRITASDS